MLATALRQIRGPANVERSVALVGHDVTQARGPRRILRHCEAKAKQSMAGVPAWITSSAHAPRNDGAQGRPNTEAAALNSPIDCFVRTSKPRRPRLEMGKAVFDGSNGELALHMELRLETPGLEGDSR